MSGFSAEWLALREPADRAARAAYVADMVTRSLNPQSTVRIVDLGCGSGANMRYLCPRLPRDQHWRLVDQDESLMALARPTVAAQVEARVVDLNDMDSSLFEECDLITASALLDLVSEKWLQRFVLCCRQAGAAVLVALNYDGRILCAPADDDDGFVRALVNLHQRTDKGFGPALGPDAVSRVTALLQQSGYQVRRATSDWVLGADRDELQQQLIAGWVAAAFAVSPSDIERIRRWERRRLALLQHHESRIVVGHQDVGAVLTTVAPSRSP